jgi:ribosome-associated protein
MGLEGGEFRHGSNVTDAHLIGNDGLARLPRAPGAATIERMEGDLVVSPALVIPLGELEIRATRSAGPGGQHVNTSSTRIEVVWDVAGSPTLADEQRARLLARLATRLDTSGRLRLVAGARRSQLQNRDAALERLAELVAAALVVPKRRKPTRPTRASKERRLTAKRQRGARKRERRDRGDD